MRKSVKTAARRKPKLAKTARSTARRKPKEKRVMAKAAVKTRNKDDEEDDGTNDVEATELETVDPKLASDVAPGFTPGTVPGADKLSKIVTDTPTYGTETPPRQTPPTSVDSPVKHSPPSFYDSNGQKIVSLAPTLSGISPSTAVSVTGADLTVTATGTNFDRATFLTASGALLSNTVYVSATSLTVVIQPSKQPGPGVVPVTAKNPGGQSAAQNFTFT
jgi:hypothetical protein